MFLGLRTVLPCHQAPPLIRDVGWSCEGYRMQWRVGRNKGEALAEGDP